ncbi:DUF4238 domain-containing protein [Actinokineospora sp. NBRC 105648]|uniref:DUF4238 domain-containing protein n=1 Tax=Actinokineospora sp. NBRC 105648 TaxID=3032206 RepID=UPI0025550A33|nr:DUF4238 domain-containing protein [Actinokineospora sp. NBRC 105648]
MYGRIYPMNKPKRHHFVPRAYLARFGRDDRVAVRWRDRHGIVVTKTQNVAVESGFYTTDEPDGSFSVALEYDLADIDGKANAAINAIVSNNILPELDSANRVTLAYYLAIQKLRTPESRAFTSFPHEVLKYAGDRSVTSALMAEYLEQVHLGFKPIPSEVAGALTFFEVHSDLLTPATRNEIVTIPFNSTQPVTELLLNMHWSLEIARKARLITSDTPMTIWHRPSRADRYRGTGIVDAEEVRFPLSPGHLLVLTPEPRPAVERVEPKRVRQCNLDQAAGCHRFIVGHPDRQRILAESPLALKRPAIRFNEAPGFIEVQKVRSPLWKAASCILGYSDLLGTPETLENDDRK